MLIHRIRIENYRSCKDIELYPGDVMALVGPNNAGKTNILAAINFVLGDRFPTRQGVALSDFYCQKEDRPISIEISFQENPRQNCESPLSIRTAHAATSRPVIGS
jgi:putative ATP-dependent endonuclease of OLD family